MDTNKIIKAINEDVYYDIMCKQFYNNIQSMEFEEIHEKWLSCFAYILRSFDVQFSYKSISSLFYDFDMDNWAELRKKNSKYKNCAKQELIDAFGEECNYISDRYSYDRLFRTHWFFRKAFEEEIDIIKYPYFYEYA